MKKEGWLHRAVETIKSLFRRDTKCIKTDAKPWIALDSKRHAEHFAKATEMVFKNSSIPIIEHLSQADFFLIRRVYGVYQASGAVEVYEFVRLREGIFANICERLEKDCDDAVLRLFVGELQELLWMINHNKRNGYENLFDIK